MTKLVKMSFIDNVCGFDNLQTYTSCIIDYIIEQSEGINYNITEKQEETLKFDLYIGTKEIFQLLFRINKVNDIFQMYVDISAECTTYDARLLDKVKFSIVKKEKRNWESIIWLYDVESEKLASKLYNLIYRTENEFRYLINEVMLKNYGVEWWDRFVPYSIKNKHNSRRANYKKSVPAFTAIDERLLSIDAGDLLDIVTVSRMEIPYIVQPTNEEDEDPIENADITIELGTVEFFNNFLNKDVDISIDNLRHMLMKSAKNSVDLWKENFADLLPNDFVDKFKEFEQNRNNIAHNKPIDYSYYLKIEKDINCLTSVIDDAIEKTSKMNSYSLLE